MRNGRSPGTGADGASHGRDAGVCPHVNRNDPRCSSRFSLGRMEQAFSVCFGAFHGCPMYHRINAEAVACEVTSAPLVAVTISA